MGLLLTTSRGVLNTALDRAAVLANTGNVVGPGTSPRRAFPTDMPLVDRGQPANSFLLYKILVRRPVSPRASFTRARCDGLPGREPARLESSPNYVEASDEERARLGDSISGVSMPPPEHDGLTLDEMLRVSRWIAEGAKVDECGACEGGP